MTSLYEGSVADLQKAEATILKLEEQLAPKQEEIDRLKKHGQKKQSDLQSIEQEQTKRDHKIEELLHQIEITKKEKHELSKKVEELTNKLKAMEQSKTDADKDRMIEKLQYDKETQAMKMSFAADLANQNTKINELEYENKMKEMQLSFAENQKIQGTKIENLERNLESIGDNLMSEMKKGMEDMKASMQNSLLQRRKAQNLPSVPTAPMHRSVNPVNAARNSSIFQKTPTTRMDLNGRSKPPLPKIEERK